MIMMAVFRQEGHLLQASETSAVLLILVFLLMEQ